MEVRQLIDGCINNDAEAWALLWQVVSSAALCPIRRLLQRQHLSLELADDVMQEFYLYIRKDDLHHLRAFRGQAMAQFRAYTRTLAVHFALNMLRRMKRIQRQEDKAARAVALPDRTGPSARQIQSALQELTSLMSEDDLAKVRHLLGDNTLLNLTGPTDASDSSPKSGRTQRRWRKELYRKYARRVR